MMNLRFISNFFRSGFVVSVFLIGFTNTNPVVAAACTDDTSTAANCDGSLYITTSTAGTISNAYVITSTGFNAGVWHLNSSLGGFHNTGTITSVLGAGFSNTGAITTLNNSGSISATATGSNFGFGIFNSSAIATLTNSGSITGASDSNDGFGIYNSSATITTLTNTGTVLGTSTSGGRFGISNYGTITTLNNAQGAGNAAGALTYQSTLPVNYNIIINSTTSFGKLSVTSGTGTTNFGIYAGSAVALGTYASVLIGLTSSKLVTRSGSYSGFNWTLLNSSDTTWDLAFSLAGPSATDTQASLNTQAQRLRSAFNSSVASSNYANMNTYDCNLFDQNNMCISAGGRITTIDNPSSHHSAAVVVLGHKISPHIRIGGFLDQSVNHNMPSGVDMSNKNPMMGAFAVWNHQADGLGYQVKLANAYLDKDVTTSRAVIGTSEAGRGRTDLNTQSYVGELSYAFNYQDSTIVRPYFALRYTNIKQDGYTENTTASVTAPLTYAKLSDRSTSALMGVKVNHALTPRTNLTASLGLEQDINHKTDQLTATAADISGLTSENFNNNIKRTRPVASAGAYYAVAKNQRLSGEVYYQQLPFQSTGSATAYFNYMIGF